MTSYSFEQFFAYRFYRALAWSPDGREIAFVSNMSGQYNLWKIAAGGGWPEQLTDFHDNAIHALAWRGNKLVFTADRDGDEFKQAYIMEKGWPRPLTNRPGVRLEMPSEAISPDGRRALYSCTARNAAATDICAIDLSTGEETRLTSDDANYFPAAWSPDGRRVAGGHHRTNSEVDTLIVEDGRVENISKCPPGNVCMPGAWTPDGKGLYVLTNVGREFTGIARYDGPKMTWVERPDWEVMTMALSPDGRLLAYVVNEDAVHRLRVKDLTTGDHVPLPEIPEGTMIDPFGGDIQFSPDGRRIALFLNAHRHPKDLYVVDLAARKLSRVTFGYIGGIPEADFVVPQQVRFGDRKIPGWIHKPRGAKKCPAILSIHGGPEWQVSAMYVGLTQYLVHRGFVVLAPNIRGSTGYGKTYQRLIYHDFGGGDIDDIKAAAEYLRSLPEVDPARMAVFGGSYGGFASLSAATRLPEYWRAAVDIFGPSNLVTFARSVPPSWRQFVDTAIGNPDTEADFLMSRSPITFIDRLRCPLLVLQGKHDPRVVEAESVQVVEKVRARGGKVEYHLFEDEGHGFSRRKNEHRAYKLIAEFLERELAP